jgi:hypothetical protein
MIHERAVRAVRRKDPLLLAVIVDHYLGAYSRQGVIWITQYTTKSPTHTCSIRSWSLWSIGPNTVIVSSYVFRQQPVIVLVTKSVEIWQESNLCLLGINGIGQSLSKPLVKLALTCLKGWIYERRPSWDTSLALSLDLVRYVWLTAHSINSGCLDGHVT